MLMRLRLSVLALACLAVVSCNEIGPEPEVQSAEFRGLTTPVPVARWDHVPASQTWTRATIEALNGPGRSLVETTPADIENWCPAYGDAPPLQRKAFWVGLVSALAKHESTWRPDVSGGNGRWHGLLQISPATARGYGCAAQTADELKNGAANLKCAIRIMGVTVPRDGVVSAGGRGVAADWGPFHQSAKRQDMQSWLRGQNYCRG
jgi:hypothetical protein